MVHNSKQPYIFELVKEKATVSITERVIKELHWQTLVIYIKITTAPDDDSNIE
ncbi:hypothetical protein ACVWYN_002210 [Pedobacter sp. UYP24]